MSEIHLHRDYHASFCGKEADHLAMTWQRDDATCDVCARAEKKAIANTAAEEAKRLAEQEAKRAKEARQEEEFRKKRDASMKRHREMMAEQARQKAAAEKATEARIAKLEAALAEKDRPSA